MRCVEPKQKTSRDAIRMSYDGAGLTMTILLLVMLLYRNILAPAGVAMAARWLLLLKRAMTKGGGHVGNAASSLGQLHSWPNFGRPHTARAVPLVVRGDLIASGYPPRMHTHTYSVFSVRPK